MLLTCATWDVDIDTAESIAGALDLALIDGTGLEQLLPAIAASRQAVSFSTVAALSARVFESISPDDSNDTLGKLSEDLAAKVCNVFDMTDMTDVEDMKFVANLLAADFAPVEKADDVLKELGRERIVSLLLLLLGGLSLMISEADGVLGGDPVRVATRMQDSVPD